MTWLDEVARGNPEYVESLYRDYCRDPAAVEERWRLVFAGYELARNGAAATDRRSPTTQVGELVHRYREFGHLIADLDPLGQSPRQHPFLQQDRWGFTESDLDAEIEWTPLRGGERGPLRELLRALRETYTDHLAVEYLGISDQERRVWLEAHIEPCRNRPDLAPEERRDIFTRLLAAERFEQFLQARYPGQKRFSLEGGESLITLLDATVEAAGRRGVEELVLGMAHRGRLNVLAHVLGKPYEMIFAEFEGATLPEDVHGDGDVKYHLGYSRDVTTSRGRTVHLSLSPNPSHLEAIDPVIEGLVRAKQSYRSDRDRCRVVPILVHGEAAFTGQGVVYETLALSALDGFTTGGTIHVIVDNQVGFTTAPSEYLFTRYPSDLAGVVHVPVVHVNADDPEAAVQAARLAVGYRQKFRTDVFVHLVCYRRHGHNELDDPTFTQPVMYERIRTHPTVVELYRRRLAADHVLDDATVRALADAGRARLDETLATARREMPEQRVFALGGVWQGLGWAGDDSRADTRVDEGRLREIGDALSRWPADFTPHPRAAKLAGERSERIRAGEGIDWATAELVAFGSLLLDGVPVRLSGQDSIRGTFSQRHTALYDTTNGRMWIPLNHVTSGQAELEAICSPLSEAGVLGFEYGMSSADPRRLCVWEAQFGDFANGAQVVIDEFVASAESKWQRMSGLVLLLPHGYEGQGPDHSSARLERFLQLCADRNLQVVNATTPAQIFHALRRQIHRRFRKPLVVMAPKSLLRHPRAVSPLRDLAAGAFRLVIDDDRVPDAGAVRRVLVCSGKIFYSLDAAREAATRVDVALVRVEQFYPFPSFELGAAIRRYTRANDVTWVQEEPANQGAWSFVRPLITEIIGPPRRLRYVGRDEAASPATGNAKIHQDEERAIVARALDHADSAAPLPDEHRAAG